MNDLVSIVIPAYNAALFIESCVNSILNQSYDNFEIIIVNDGSKDNTAEILGRLAEKDNRIHIISQENKGVSAARNSGLASIKGKFLTFVDADDELEENALENMVSMMKDGVDLLVCSHNEVRFSKVPHIHEKKIITNSERNERFREFDRVVWWPWGKMFRADIIRYNNLRYDESINFGEDHLFNLLYGKYMTGSVVISDIIVYNYYYIRGGLCSKYYPDFNRLQKYILIQMADFFGGIENFPKEQKNLYFGSYLRGCIDYYAAWLSFGRAAEKISETFEMYDELISDEILSEQFTPEQCGLINNKDYKSFTKNYIINNPRNTVIRKYARKGRRALEKMQRIFLGRK